MKVRMGIRMSGNWYWLGLLRPSVRGRFLRRLMRSIGESVSSVLRDNSQKFFVKGYSKGGIYKSWFYEVARGDEPKSVVIGNKKEYAKILDYIGVKPHTMVYLLKENRKLKYGEKGAMKLIPIWKPAEGLNFRWATIRAMAEGKWRHPGLKPLCFVDDGIRVWRSYGMLKKCVESSLWSVKVMVNEFVHTAGEIYVRRQ